MFSSAELRDAIDLARRAGTTKTARVMAPFVLGAIAGLTPFGLLSLRISREMRLLRHRTQSLERETRLDGLTGLYNRRFLDEELARELSRTRRLGQPLSIAMADIDLFKRVNDGYGHAAGDEVLKRLAIVLRQVLRTSDIACRYGGEEFVLILPNTPLDGARRLAERIRLAVQESGVIFERRTIAFSISLGLAEAVLPCTAASLVQEADRNLYEAKNRGRNRVWPAIALLQPDPAGLPALPDAPDSNTPGAEIALP